MDNLVTVIIPVYKVEKYLPKCIESVQKQTYKNLDIILVDDGSPDSCGEICDKYAKNDSRIRVIHKVNGGLSDARNAGLDIARGSSISFIDSDDYVSPEFIRVMHYVMTITDSEIVALHSGTNFWDGEEEVDFKASIADTHFEKVKPNDAIKRMLYTKIGTGAPFKLYKKELWNDVRFPKGYLYEDVATTYKLFMKAKQAAIIDESLYAYRLRGDSIVRQKFSKKKMICLDIAEQLIGDIKEYDNSLLPAAISRVYSMVYSVFLQVPKDDSEDMIRLWKWMKKYRAQIIHDKSPLVRKKNKYGAIISYLGKNASYYIGRKFGQKGSMTK